MVPGINKNLLSFVIGLSAGMFGGLIGLGGGLIMIPLMVGVLKLSQHQAHGTSLVALVFTGLSGAVAYSLKGSVDYTAALLLAATAIMTARAGAHYAHALSASRLRKLFGAFLLFCAVLLLFKPYLVSAIGVVPGYARIIVFLLTGIFTGFLSGMMGVGGGTIMVPAMVLLAGLSQHIAQGTSLLVMVPAGGVGALTHWKLGNVAKTVLPALITGIIIGAYLGASFANVLPDAPLRLLFVAVIAVTGLRYVQSPAAA